MEETPATFRKVAPLGRTGLHRPRLLFLAYYFPPANKIGGVRAFNMAKALASRGWDVTMVSPAVAMWRSVELETEVAGALERAGIRCVRTGHTWRNLSPYDLSCRDGRIAWIFGGICRRTARFLSVENQIGWLEQASRACAALDAEDVDLVLATGPPFTSFRLASRIAERLRRPYILDYRDPWTGNPHTNTPARLSTTSTESALIRRASAVMAVSPHFANSLRATFDTDEKVYVVTNGYDADDLANVKPWEFGHFAIVYAGQFYPPKRVIGPLLKVLARLRRMGSLRLNWRFHYFGPHSEHVRSAMANEDLTSQVVIHGNVPRRDALAALAGAGASVVITSVSESASREDLGVVPGKVFEAIGLGRPVLAVAPQGSDLEMILATSGLGQSFTGTQVEPMAKFLADLINGRSMVARTPERYSWSAIGETVDAVLRGVLAARPHPAALNWPPSAEKARLEFDR